MSIHRSKGLEFPVVILADLNKQFNEQDLKRPVLVHPALGLGCERVDRARHIRYDSVSKSALALALRREAKAEEMRILYVALTRAKEKLICIDCMKRAGARVREPRRHRQLSRQTGGRCLGAGARRLAAAAAAAERAGRADPPLGRAGRRAPAGRGGLGGLSAGESDAAGGSALRRTRARAAGGGGAALRSRRSSTGFIRTLRPRSSPRRSRRRSSRAARSTRRSRRTPRRSCRVRAVSFEKPRFLQKERGLTAAERGTAMHAGDAVSRFRTPGGPSRASASR